MDVADVLDLYEEALRKVFDDQIAMVEAVEYGVLRAEAHMAGVEIDPLPRYEDILAKAGEQPPEWAQRFQEANRGKEKR